MQKSSLKKENKLRVKENNALDAKKKARSTKIKLIFVEELKKTRESILLLRFHFLSRKGNSDSEVIKGIRTIIRELNEENAASNAAYLFKLSFRRMCAGQTSNLPSNKAYAFSSGSLGTLSLIKNNNKNKNKNNNNNNNNNNNHNQSRRDLNNNNNNNHNHNHSLKLMESVIELKLFHLLFQRLSLILNFDKELLEGLNSEEQSRRIYEKLTREAVNKKTTSLLLLGGTFFNRDYSPEQVIECLVQKDLRSSNTAGLDSTSAFSPPPLFSLFLTQLTTTSSSLVNTLNRPMANLLGLLEYRYADLLKKNSSS